MRALFKILPGMTLSAFGSRETAFPAMAAGFDGSKVHIFYQFLNPETGDYYWAEVDDASNPIESTIVKPRRDANFQSVPFPVFIFGRPGSPQEGFVFTASNPSAPPQWFQGYPYLVKGWPLGAKGQPLNGASVAGARYAAGTDVEAQYNPPAPVDTSSKAPSWIGEGGLSLIMWVTALLRLWAGVRELPAPPKPSTDITKAFKDHFDYVEALAMHAMTTEFIDAVSRIIERALVSGRKLVDPSPDLIKKITPFMRDGVNLLTSLRTPPVKPTAGTSAAKNIENLNAYTHNLAEFAASADFLNSAADVAEQVLTKHPGGSDQKLLTA